MSGNSYKKIDQHRRDFIKKTGIGLLAFNVKGAVAFLTPREARARDVPYSVLSGDEVRTLEALAEVLLPGAADDGIAHYIDHHLSVPSPESLLMIRYLDIPPPYAPFYQLSLANLDGYAKAEHGAQFTGLDSEQQSALVAEISAENPEGWNGPPAPLFYFVLRSDAVDVVYGTVEGFRKLDIPYMAHIMPPSKW